MKTKVRKHHGRWAASCTPCLWTQTATSLTLAYEAAATHVHRTVLGPAQISEETTIAPATSTAATTVKDARPDAWGWQGLSTARPLEVW